MRTYYPEEYFRRSGYKLPLKNEVLEKKQNIEKSSNSMLN